MSARDATWVYTGISLAVERGHRKRARSSSSADRPAGRGLIIRSAPMARVVRPSIIVFYLCSGASSALSVPAGIPKVPSDAILEAAQGLCVGFACGYAGMATTARAFGAIGVILRRGGRKEKAVASSKGDCTTIEGRWILDATRSESLEPFLIAVGAPKLIAKMVGRKGKPMEIAVDKAAVTVTIEGKGSELVKFGVSRPLDTPKGSVLAIATADNARRKLTITKRGPAPDEVVTEQRELSHDGRQLTCTFTHRRGQDPPIVVVRYYVRA